MEEQQSNILNMIWNRYIQIEIRSQFLNDILNDFSTGQHISEIYKKIKDLMGGK